MNKLIIIGKLQEKVECLLRSNVIAWQYKKSSSARCGGESSKFWQGPWSIFYLLYIVSKCHCCPEIPLAPVLHWLCFPQYLPSAAFLLEATKSRGFAATSLMSALYLPRKVVFSSAVLLHTLSTLSISPKL